MFPSRATLPALDSTDSESDSIRAEHGSESPSPAIISGLAEAAKPSLLSPKSTIRSSKSQRLQSTAQDRLAPPAQPNSASTTPNHLTAKSFKPKTVAIEESEGLSVIRESGSALPTGEEYSAMSLPRPGRRQNSERFGKTKARPVSNLEGGNTRLSLVSLFNRNRQPSDDESNEKPKSPTNISSFSLTLSRRSKTASNEPEENRISTYSNKIRRPSAIVRAMSLPGGGPKLGLFGGRDTISPSSSSPYFLANSRIGGDSDSDEDDMVEYRHDSVTEQVLQFFRKLETSSGYLPEYIKRKIPRLRRALVPRIHLVEDKLEQWPWLVEYCEHWGIPPLLMVLGILGLVFFQRIYRKNAKLVSTYVGFVFPLYKTVMMLMSPTEVITPNRLLYGQQQSYTNTAHEMEKWKAYWPIYAAVLAIDELSTSILQVFPLYYTTRSVFCYWLYNNNGANYLFYKYLEPLWETTYETMTSVDKTVNSVTSGKTEFDYLKEVADITAEIARHRLVNIWHKLRNETRFNESCQNILKSIVINRDQIIASKDERGLREDIEKSQQKIALLVEAEKRYKKLINWFVDENGLPELPVNNTKINAQLRIKIERISLKSSTDLTSPTKQKLDLFAVITINDFPKAKTSRISAQLRDEHFEIPIDRLSNRVEIQVFQSSLMGNHQLLGLCWFTVGDLREELLDKYFSVFPVDVPDVVLTLEPNGYVVLKANLVEPTRVKQNPLANDILQDLKDEDIFLTDDIRKIYTKNGHQFQIFKAVNSIASDVIGARCSVCEESMIGGMRCYCQRCSFVCHTRCFKGVLTKCINQDDIQSAPIGADLNTGQLLDYNKPHAFEPRSMNLRSWCTHCGLKIMPNERRVQCSQCVKSAHEKCQPLVPNFCGLSLAEAAAIAIKEDFQDKQRLGSVLGFSKRS